MMSKNPFTNARMQLATLRTTLPKEDGWLYEMKYDGYRIMAFVEQGRVRLVSRNGRDFASVFNFIASALLDKLAGRSAVIDGEAVVVDGEGKTDFQALQNSLKGNKNQPVYVMFDLLAVDGEDIRNQPLVSRKQRLSTLFDSLPQCLHLSGFEDSLDEQMLQRICDKGFEGIVAKRAESQYTGTRNGDWVKLKCIKRQEFVVGGFCRSAKKAGGIASLLLGYYEDGELIYAGSVGSGISQRVGEELSEKFQKITRKTSPFKGFSKKQARSIVWLSVKYIAEVQFSEWTNDNLLRHPSLKGIRLDKQLGSEALEHEQKINQSVKGSKRDKLSKKFILEQEEQAGQLASKGSKKVNEPELDGKAQMSRGDTRTNFETMPSFGEIVITNGDKLLYVNPNITKNEVADYYRKVSQRMLPLVEGRLLSLVNCPKGITQPCFFNKHILEAGRGIATLDMGKDKGRYFYLSSALGLIERVQMNAIEFHMWGSHVQSLELPDIMVFDLDPDEGMDLERICQGVMDLKNTLLELGLVSFVKTSGGKGYHLVVPLTPLASWQGFGQFAKNTAEMLAQRWPMRYTANMRKQNRKGKIFIDWMRNTRGATHVAPYSLRARKGATVSMPIAFGEIGRVAPDDITMDKVQKRLKLVDPWKDFFKVKKSQSISDK